MYRNVSLMISTILQWLVRQLLLVVWLPSQDGQEANWWKSAAHLNRGVKSRGALRPGLGKCMSFKWNIDNMKSQEDLLSTEQHTDTVSDQSGAFSS